MRYGRTLARTADGDIRFENGEPVWLEGVDAVEQELKNTLETVRGEDPFDPEHGFDAFAATGAPDVIVEREVRIALSSDDRVDSVDEVVVGRVDSVDEVVVGDVDENRSRPVEVTVSLVDGPGLTFDSEVN